MPVDSMIPLEGNPRRGDVDAIAASYSEFGQLKPIVVRDNGDGRYTVIAGNHQLEAAKSLGWDKIAAVVIQADKDRALAYALADNRTMELGHSDQSLVIEMISQISNEYSELLGELKWDEFEIAAMEEWSERNSSSDDGMDSGYLPPVMVQQIDEQRIDISQDSDGQVKLTARSGVDSLDAATRGSTTVSQSTGSQAVVQYTLVFDNPEQQKDWYSFIRYLRNSTVYEGATTAERLMNFVRAHADY